MKISEEIKENYKIYLNRLEYISFLIIVTRFYILVSKRFEEESFFLFFSETSLRKNKINGI